MRTLRTLLAIYSARGFYFGQIDVETAYLYALLTLGCTHLVGTENEIWILVYVDDIIFASKNEQTKDIFAGHLRKKYRITEPTTDMGTRNESIVRADGIILTQDLYVSKILERFGFTSAAKSATTPLAHGTTLTRADEEDAEARHLAQQFVGAILYAAVISRPDLSSTVRVMSHVMSKPPSNFEACKKHVLREALVDHPTSHRRTKHIEIRREFIKFHIGHETVKIERVSTKDQLADILTKPLRQDIHNYLVQMILHG
ncbi:hypothetical protein RI054_06g35580 [Pseudoscourfieldia marina]